MSKETQVSQLRISIYCFAIGLLPLIFMDRGEAVLFLNKHHSPQGDWFFRQITYLGDGLIFVPLIVTCVFIRFRYAIIALLTALVHCGLVALFKRVLFSGMPRPAKLLDQEMLHFVPGVDVHSYMSFPSGHTASAFAVALFLSLMVRNHWLTCFFMIIATFIGISRMYLLQHFYMDVYAGMIIGTFSTLFAWQLVNSLAFFNRLDSRLALTLVSRPQLSDTKPRSDAGAPV